MAGTTRTIGANLTVAELNGMTKKISKGLKQIANWAEVKLGGRVTGVSQNILDYGGPRVFVKAGAPAANTAADSPGMDLCLVYDSTNKDFYLINTWVSSTSFAATKIID